MPYTPADIQEISDSMWGKSIEGGYTAEQLLRMLAAVLLGKVSGAGSGQEVFSITGGDDDMATSVVDNMGNRTEVTLTP